MEWSTFWYSFCVFLPLRLLWVVLILVYKNLLSSGTTEQLIDKLQKVQNCSAQLIFKTFKRTRVSTLLTKLHWLPIVQRIDYKVPSRAIAQYCTILHCPTVPAWSTLSPLTFGVPKRRKRRRKKSFSCRLPFSVSLGINSHTLQAIFQHNPNSKSISKPHYSNQPTIKT